MANEYGSRVLNSRDADHGETVWLSSFEWTDNMTVVFDVNSAADCISGTCDEMDRLGSILSRFAEFLTGEDFTVDTFVYEPPEDW